MVEDFNRICMYDSSFELLYNVQAFIVSNPGGVRIVHSSSLPVMSALKRNALLLVQKPKNKETKPKQN